MGRPRMIILVRHAQSEGNKNRDIHQFIPDHRVSLTPDGWGQAEEAGRRLRSMLKPDDTIQFFTSPYRRTRETTEGILRTLCSDDPAPSPFPRHKIKVFEEPRLREQDFGNFQPCSAEMERMWQERADYGHFFYRIPNGESAADAYDRISGFNESMWRQFGEPDFPSVCVLVTHGLMTRVFLMKWYHWSVEYFEDLRNVNHCEFIIMKQNQANQKYILENELRTWSDLRRRAAAATGSNPAANPAATPSKTPAAPGNLMSSPSIPTRRWGGCVNGCNHDKINFPRRVMRKNTAEYFGGSQPAPAMTMNEVEAEKEDNPLASQEADHTPVLDEPVPSKLTRKASVKSTSVPHPLITPASPNDASDDASSEHSQDELVETSEVEEAAQSIPHNHQHPAPRPHKYPAPQSHNHPPPRTAGLLHYLHPGTPGEGFSDDSDYFPGMQHRHAGKDSHHGHGHSHGHSHGAPVRSSSLNGNSTKSRLRASSKQRQASRDRKAAVRKMSEKEELWVAQSGMGAGAMADALGDGVEDKGTQGRHSRRNHLVQSNDPAVSPKGIQDVREEAEEEVEEGKSPVLPEALKGDMIVEKSVIEEPGDIEDEDPRALSQKMGGLSVQEVKKLKDQDRKGFSEVY